MDKAEFVEKAPPYYALAIAVVLRRQDNPRTEHQLKSEYPDHSDGAPEPESLLDRWVLWDGAVAWLLARNMIKIRHDPFGPPIFSKGPQFEENWEVLENHDSFPFSSYAAAAHSGEWLMSALYAVNNTYANLEMEPGDFENPDAQWEPVKIDLTEPTVKEAISSLERIIEDVRSDNGYSATLPQERDFVLEGLQGTLDKFKSSSVSAGYIRTAIERLGILQRRFASTIKEAAISGAKLALIEFAKKHLGDALNYMWKFLF